MKQKKPRSRGLRTRGRGTWKKDKPLVMTMVKRGEHPKVRFKVMKNFQNMKVKLSRLITDEYTIYEGIAGDIEEILDHWVVNHSEKEWARDSVHIDGCENRNQFLKAYLRRYRGVSKRYLQGLSRFFSSAVE